MSAFNIGKYIKTRREELGISQEVLADGICATATLSRIECGGRKPKDTTLKLILQRLGLSGAELQFMTEESEIVMNQLKFDIRQSCILSDYKTAEMILRDNKDFISRLKPIDRQSFETIGILVKIHKNELTHEEALNQLESVLRITCPKYTKDNLPKFLSYEEILLLNNIAQQYDYLGDRNTTIDMLYHIKNFYDTCVCDKEEALRTQPMILYNLSKCLGLAKRIDESIEISNQGIRLAIKTGRSSSLARTLYNLAYGLYERNNPGDKEASLYYAKQAYNLAIITQKETSAEHYKEFILSRFKIEV